ncbi:hypothetical protein V8G54_006676 [Vigna mungo]|uniref:Uncharacterized protein n=1 Tax=Vigna mungo TaxID=3915 RepID=A0AAQ3S8B4_VIGMU
MFNIVSNSFRFHEGQLHGTLMQKYSLKIQRYASNPSTILKVTHNYSLHNSCNNINSYERSGGSRGYMFSCSDQARRKAKTCFSFSNKLLLQSCISENVRPLCI